MSENKVQKKVAVLLSTYNGEKYILEQLQSLRNQYTDFPVDIHIRDDGSNDNTCKIIQDYSKNKGSVFLYQGDNIGVVASFLWLVDNINGYDYYAFCDQDDVWEPLKIFAAVHKLEPLGQNTATVYCSAYDYVDQELKFLGNFRSRSDFSLNNILIENCAPGCTLLFNNRMREVYKDITLENISRKIIMHDWFFVILASIFGKVVYDNNSYLLYRQHANNVVGKKNGFISILLAKIKQFNKDKRKKRHPLSIQMELVAECCADNKKQCAYIISEKFNSSQTNLFKRMSYIVSGHIIRAKFIDDVIFKALYVFGYFK
ncbi:glycosyltransferase family 2 protein [Citrobacter sedlakii]|uniref:glycosyltransferase family 2 protein n=1 Tax=Citrobacter sedlakii TaxID=67826 RepID=UPI0022B45243|nr:glycosyltransferase family 2 protein [Citrobacter sedlakii]MCZ4673875.1 glycosyltransferase family 2 protein [Citrobacter sedlakii]MDR5003931.1 glycosyltransferase family 2 protein [Citrobacter sedlakii]